MVWSGKRTCGREAGMAVLLSFRVDTSRQSRVGACTVRLQVEPISGIAEHIPGIINLLRG
jgi:hypothetical protein